MGFISNLVSATVKTVLTPVAVVKDAFDVVVGDEPNNTKNLIGRFRESTMVLKQRN